MKGGDTLGEVIVHFDREWKGDVIRCDYKWENDKGDEYLIKDIPCVDFPFANKDYLSEKVSLALEMIIYLQQNKEVPNVVDFTKIEDLV